jgi:uncharacterized protein with LGFP repeats
MRKMLWIGLLGAVCGAAVALAATAAKAKTYQITGPVVEVTDTKIVVQKKEDDKWEIARDGETKVEGDIAVGAKVTVEYRMTATKVAVKADK